VEEKSAEEEEALDQKAEEKAANYRIQQVVCSSSLLLHVRLSADA